ncbi:NADP-reducing hydrogenase subunit HndA [Candidatus Izimaplasma bacterium HR1]|jgi:NADH:ubiquinone oxidoreductase subunit E|uniref:NADH-quinone oxidoreductase subunit NuoE family protein n=1 Tax=Candidatus Izimoplasma sp. HR1 TaxID=1541959 RepID=UPI0004F77A0B|nr:NADP-reducing hydrogenase subunit HndA [Candidatus Izimaplasma bacterium HR1]
MSEINLNIDELDKDLLAELDIYIASLQDPRGTLINVLHRAQILFGYIPHNLQLYISRKLDLNAARVNGVVSFYSYFSEEKTGKNVVSVCMGTACYVKGSEKVLHKCLDILKVGKNEITEDGLFTVRDVRCIGACGLAPVLTVGEKVYGHVDADMVEGILNRYRGEEDGN